MNGRWFTLFLPLCLYLSSAEAERDDRKRYLDHRLGEVAYLTSQGRHLEALVSVETLLDEVNANDPASVARLAGRNDFAVDEIELAYRLSHRSGRAIRSAVEISRTDLERNHAAYRLARNYYERKNHRMSRHALALIRGDIPDAIEEDIRYLDAKLKFVEGEYDRAHETFLDAGRNERYTRFAQFNAAVSMIRSGQEEEGMRRLAELGGASSEDPVVMALADKANIVLGYRFIELSRYADAEKHLNRIRLDGPYSNRALLGGGWAAMAQDKAAAALTRWQILADRVAADANVHEAWLATAYAYGQLGQHLLAAESYGVAAERYGEQIVIIDTMVEQSDRVDLADRLAEIFRAQVMGVGAAEQSTDLASVYLAESLSVETNANAVRNYLDLRELLEEISARRDAITTMRAQVTASRSREREQIAALRSRLDNAKDLAAELQLITARPDASGDDAARVNEIAEAQSIVGRLIERIDTQMTDRRGGGDGYAIPLQGINERLQVLEQQVVVLKDLLSDLINTNLYVILLEHRERLIAYRNKATLYEATSYDKVTSHAGSSEVIR